MKRRGDSKTPLGKLAREEHDFREGVRKSKKRLRKGQTPRATERGQTMDQLITDHLTPLEQ